MKKIIELNILNEEVLSPESYLKLTDADKANISYSEIIPPRLGKRDFGKIRVHYKTPRYIKIK